MLLCVKIKRDLAIGSMYFAVSDAQFYLNDIKTNKHMLQCVVYFILEYSIKLTT